MSETTLAPRLWPAAQPAFSAASTSGGRSTEHSTTIVDSVKSGNHLTSADLSTRPFPWRPGNGVCPPVVSVLLVGILSALPPAAAERQPAQGQQGQRGGLGDTDGVNDDLIQCAVAIKERNRDRPG